MPTDATGGKAEAGTSVTEESWLGIVVVGGRYFIGRVSTACLMKDKQNCVIIRVISKYRRLTQGRDESRLAKYCRTKVGAVFLACVGNVLVAQLLNLDGILHGTHYHFDYLVGALVEEDFSKNYICSNKLRPFSHTKRGLDQILQ